MASVCMTTWLRPSISVFSAAGISTFQSSCRGVQPAMRPASRMSGGTVRKPRIVQRAMGGRAKAKVASIAGTWPKPKRMTTGPR